MEIRLACNNTIVLNEEIYIKPEDPMYKDVYNAYKVLHDAEFCREDHNYAVKLAFSSPGFIVEQLMTIFGKNGIVSEKSELIECINVLKYNEVTHYIHDMLEAIYTKPFNEHLRTVCIHIDSECYEAEKYHYPNYFMQQYSGRYSWFDNMESNDNYNVIGMVDIQRTEYAPTVTYEERKGEWVDCGK